MLLRLDTPSKIQAFLDEVPYSTEERYRCPLSVLRENRAHCFDGALFAAAALRRLGYAPRIVYLIADRDDDHLVAVYNRNRHWGAVGKSNYVGLRLREPVYRTLRELVMSYFEQYFNIKREKTLRSYTVPLNLRAFDGVNWMTSDDSLEAVADRLDEIRHFRIVTPSMIASLSPIDKLSYRAGMLGSNRAGLYKPE